MKKLQNGIYIVPGMKCKQTGHNQYIVKDEFSDTDLDPNDMESKILIYEREQVEWLLKPANKLELDSFISSPIIVSQQNRFLE